MAWRYECWKRNYRRCAWGIECLLPDKALTKLTRSTWIVTREQLRLEMPDWDFGDRHGGEALEVVARAEGEWQENNKREKQLRAEAHTAKSAVSKAQRDEDQRQQRFAETAKNAHVRQATASSSLGCGHVVLQERDVPRNLAEASYEAPVFMPPPIPPVTPPVQPSIAPPPYIAQLQVRPSYIAPPRPSYIAPPRPSYIAPPWPSHIAPLPPSYIAPPPPYITQPQLLHPHGYPVGAAPGLSHLAPPPLYAAAPWFPVHGAGLLPAHTAPQPPVPIALPQPAVPLHVDAQVALPQQFGGARADNDERPFPPVGWYYSYARNDFVPRGY